MNWLPTSASTFAEGVDFTLWLATIISVISCILIGFLPHHLRPKWFS